MTTKVKRGAGIRMRVEAVTALGADPPPVTGEQSGRNRLPVQISTPGLAVTMDLAHVC